MNEESRKIIEKLKALRPRLESEFGIKRLRVFGSVGRGEATPDSDVDLLVNFEKTPNLLKMAGIKRKIEADIDREIDLLTENSVHHALKDIIFKEASDV